MEDLRSLARKAHHSSADVIIGKNGLTEAVLREIDVRLKAKGYVKVRILKRGLEAIGLERREIAYEVSKRLGAKLAGIRGRTFVIYRERPIKGRESMRGPQLRAKKSRSNSQALGRWK